MKTAIILVLLLIFAGTVHADFNAKAVDSITLKITQTGQLITEGSVERVNLTLYIPQEGIQELKVTSDQKMLWKYGSDQMGNKIIILNWAAPTGTVTYTVETTVKNTAKYVNPTTDIGNDPTYLKQTGSILLADDIRQAAYPYEKSWDNVARLTEFVYNYVTYDISLVGARENSEWVFRNKRGVCVEHANLLTALLRASGIPTRYVVGYAYSNIDKKLIGHTWVEVLASDGTWVPFDPTWLQGGYLDATHIKTGNLLDDNQTETLSYFGPGAIIRSGQSIFADKVEVLDYTEKNATTITLAGRDAPLGGFGYVKADISSLACTINQLSVQPCVDENNKQVLTVYEKERDFFSCNSKTIYWFFKDNDGKSAYSCPVTIYDQVGSSQDINMKVTRDRATGEVFLGGPEVAGVNEPFTLTANANGDYVFYSPAFGEHMDKTWTLTANRPGNYTFYLYAGGRLAQKTVSVVGKREFSLAINVPANATVGDTFLVNVDVKNLGPAKTVTIATIFGDQKTEEQQTFSAYEEKAFSKNLTVVAAGIASITVTVTGDSLTSYSTYITVYNKAEAKGFFDFISGFFSSIGNFFSHLFSS